MGEALDFSIVVATRNRPEQLAQLLRSLGALDYPADRFEVIVVDDGSDLPLDAAVGAAPAQLRLTTIRRKHAGPAVGRNTGAAAAKGRWLAFVDDDCEPHQDWLTALARRHEAAGGVIVGGRTVNGLPTNPYSASSQFIADIVYAYYNGDGRDARFFATNNMSVPREEFLSLGGFDESYEFACEDRDFCARWKEAGRSMVYEPTALVKHSHPLHMRSYCRQHFSYGQGAVAFHRKVEARGAGHLRDHFGFHARMPSWFARAWQRHPAGMAVRVWFLLIVWQVVNATGYFQQRWRR